MIKLLKNLKGKMILFAILAPLFMILEVSMDFIQPTLMSDIIDIGIVNKDVDYIIEKGIYMLISAVLGFLGGALCSLFAAVTSMTLAEKIRGKLFKKINSLSFAEIDKLKTSSLITRLANDVNQFQQMVNMTLRGAVRSPLLAIGGIIMARRLSPDLSIIFIIVIPIIVTVIYIILKKSMPLFKKVQERIDEINLVMRENILGIRVIKAFNLERNQKERFIKKNEKLKKSNIDSQNINLTLWPFASFVMNLSVVCVFWFGGNMVNTGELQVGKIMAFVNYLIQIMNATIRVINIMLNISRAKASADRINEVLEMKTSIINKENTASLENYDIEFKNVSFKYNKDSENVLENINLKIKEGERVGIIGPTGSGKSSLIALIPRLYDATEGKVFLGNKNIKDYQIKDLRNNIGVVLQENILFSGTIESNIKFGNSEATLEEMINSANDSQALEFIESKENRFKEKVEQRGRNLSGGQKQRLSITRTLVRNNKILIMDDSSSALDMKTQEKLQNAINNREKKETIITIAQRISAVKECDKIIVLDGGKISNIGTHNELLKINEIYRSIAVSQLGEEILEDVK